MLISRRGFNAFNEYDLSSVLETRLHKLREQAGALVHQGESEKVYKLIEDFKVAPLVFEEVNISVESRKELIPAEYFPHGYFVRPGNSYEKDVLVFHLPFKGDSELLHCVPSQRILWTEEIAEVGGEVIFELIKFGDDVAALQSERDRIVKMLTQQASYVRQQVDKYNEEVDKAAQEALLKTKILISKHDEFLAALGTPKRVTSTLRPPASQAPSGASTLKVAKKDPKKYDAFICHASEDKAYVDKLAKAFAENDMSVWYDTFQIGWGDDLRPTIDEGLKNSRFGIVVFSKAFLAKKKWTEYELNSLFSKEKQGQKVILPIWHEITRDDVSSYSLAFADRIAKRSDDLPEIVEELKRILKA